MEIKLDSFFKCVCHPDWKKNKENSFHRVPIDCIKESKKDYAKLCKQQELKEKKEKQVRLNKKYKNWEEEIEDKWNHDTEVGGWYDWTYGGVQLETVKKFIKRIIESKKGI